MTYERWVVPLRKALLVIAFLVFGAGVVAGRTLLSGHTALEQAERAFDSGDLRESVRQARRAATFALPGAPHVDLAYRRLVVIARGAEASGRPHLAAFAWSSIRSAAIETAAPGWGVRPELELANRNLARLASRLGPGGVEDPKLEREMLGTLERPPAQSPWGLALWGGGACLVALGLLWGGRRGLTREGGIVGRHLLIGALCVVIGAACWTLASYRA